MKYPLNTANIYVFFRDATQNSTPDQDVISQFFYVEFSWANLY